MLYLVTYNVYMRYEIDYTETRGIFSTRENAELYLKQHQYELDVEHHYDEMYFEIIEHELDGGLE